MLFIGINSTLELEVKGYQFPEQKIGSDANWLIVSVKVSYNNDYWEKDYPLLSTQRLVDFRNWIKSICDEECKRKNFAFSKSDISFSYLGKQENFYKFRIILKYGCLSQDFHFNTFVDNSSIFIESSLDLNDLLNFLSILQQFTVSFPIKC